MLPNVLVRRHVRRDARMNANGGKTERINRKRIVSTIRRGKRLAG